MWQSCNSLLNSSMFVFICGGPEAEGRGLSKFLARDSVAALG